MEIVEPATPALFPEEIDEIPPVMEAITMTDRLCDAFEWELSKEGKMAVTAVLLRMMSSLHARTTKDVPSSNMGLFVQSMLRRIESGEIQ